MTYTTRETLISNVNKILADRLATKDDIKSIEMDEDALKFFSKFWLTRHKSDDEVEAQLNHQSFNIGDLVGSYRGVKVFCGHPGSVYFYNSLGHDVARLVLKDFRKDFIVNLEVVFDKLKGLLDLDEEADEFDVLLAVALLARANESESTVRPTERIVWPIPEPTIYPYPTTSKPLITWETRDYPVGGLDMYDQPLKTDGKYPTFDDIYDAQN